jgi:hypothetical protein
MFPVPIANDKFPALPLLVELLFAITFATEILLLPATVNVMFPALLSVPPFVVLELRFCNEREPLLAVIVIFPPLAPSLAVVIVVPELEVIFPKLLVIVALPPDVEILPRLVIP